MWIDSHCHLNHKNFEGKEIPEIIEDFSKNQIDGCVTICCRISEEIEQLLDICEHNKNIKCTIGTHPCDASNENEKRITVDNIIKYIQDNENIVGIGESGLDYYWDTADPKDQKQSFIKHIQACQETGLPLIVHARNADQDIGDILEQEYKNKEFTCVMYCYSSGEKLAMRSLDIGFYISFSGIITFKSAKELQDIAKKVPQDRILIETDAPFLAPTPYRGKQNRPSYVRHTGEFLAHHLKIEIEEFAKITSDNFYRLFTRASF